MTEHTSSKTLTGDEGLQAGSFYKVPKWLVWSAVPVLFLWIFYKTNDWWQHVNWPPADQRNVEITKALNCDKIKNYTVTKEMLKGTPDANSFQPVGVDRLLYVERPACAAIGTYLSLEGSGVRRDFNVYDMTTGRKTANIVITHERFNQK